VGELLLDLDVCALMQDCGEEEHRAEGRFPMALNSVKTKKNVVRASERRTAWPPATR